MSGFLRGLFAVVWRRGWWLIVLNWLFFGLIIVGSLLGQSGLVETVTLFNVVEPVKFNNVLLLFGFIFSWNLVLSGFFLLTVTGLVFFGLSVVFLSVRAFLWGLLLNGLSTSAFLASLPTVILEGEGYVLAALAGLILGLSWLKPSWVYKIDELIDEEGDRLPRSEVLKKALKDAAKIYVSVAVFLFVAAIVEAVTLTII